MKIPVRFYFLEFAFFLTRLNEREETYCSGAAPMAAHSDTPALRWGTGRRLSPRPATVLRCLRSGHLRPFPPGVQTACSRTLSSPVCCATAALLASPKYPMEQKGQGRNMALAGTRQGRPLPSTGVVPRGQSIMRVCSELASIDQSFIAFYLAIASTCGLPISSKS